MKLKFLGLVAKHIGFQNLCMHITMFKIKLSVSVYVFSFLPFCLPQAKHVVPVHVLGAGKWKICFGIILEVTIFC